MHHRVDHLLRQRARVDDHRVDAAGLGDQRNDRPRARGERAVDRLRDRQRAGKAHAADPQVGDQRGADRFARAVHERERAFRDARLVKQRDHAGGDGRRLFGRLGDHAVAGDERGHDLAAEDRQREVPRADAGEDAAAVEMQFVALAGRAGQRPRDQPAFGLVGVVAAEVDRLANFGDAVALGLAGLDDEHGAELRHACFEPIGSATQHGGTTLHRGRIPCRERGDAAADGGFDLGRAGLRDRRDAGLREPGDCALDRLALREYGEIDAARVGACRRLAGPIEIDRQRQRACAGRSRQRRRQQFLDIDRGIRQLMHERRVRPVLQQPPHQIGQQVPMLPHRRVNAQRHPPHQAARLSGGPGGRGRHRSRRESGVPGDLPVHRLSHAVQPLHLEARPARLGHLHDRRDRSGVVGGELWVDHVAVADQCRGRGEVGHVGVRLFGEDRVAGQAHFLGALDLAVPVRALDQADHEAQATIPADPRNLVDDLDGARLIRLDGQAEATPLRVRAGYLEGERLEHVEREFEAVALLGVDRQVQVGLGGKIDELAHPRHELGEHPRTLCLLVAREQRRELDRDAVGVFRATAGARPGDGTDRSGVRGEVAHGVALAARALAEHVVAEAKRGRGLARRRRLAERFADRAAEHELAAEQLDRPHGRGHDGLGAEAAQQPGVAIGVGQETLGKRDRAGRQAGDQAMRAGALVTGGSGKVGPAELVGRQGDRGLGIGNAQQRFREPHQSQALAARDRILLQQ